MIVYNNDLYLEDSKDASMCDYIIDDYLSEKLKNE